MTNDERTEMLLRALEQFSRHHPHDAVATAALLLHEDLCHLTPASPARAREDPNEEDGSVFGHLRAIARHQEELIALPESPIQFKLSLSGREPHVLGRVIGLPGCTITGRTDDEVIAAAPETIRYWMSALGRDELKAEGARRVVPLDV